LQLISVTIEKYAPPGNGLGFYQGKAVFVAQAVVGDKLLVKIEKEKKRYIIGSLSEIIKAAPERCQPSCPHYEKCGGCDLLQLSYADQLSLKQDMLEQVLAGSGTLVPATVIAAPRTTAYRHRAIFHFDHDLRQIGFLQRRSHKVVPVPDCPILAPGLQKLLSEFSENPELLLSGISTCYALANSRGEYAAVGCRGRFSQRNLKVLKNISETVTEDYGFGELELAAAGFAQVNPQITAIIIKDLISHCADSDVIAELYGGSGTLSLALATVATQLTVYESDLAAAARGRHNLKRNGFENVRFIGGRVEKSKLKSNLNTLVVDPPRVGLSPAVVEMMARSSVAKIIYISCNPATLARDISRLKDLSPSLTLKSIQAYDMYPGTTHLEVMAVMER